MDGGFGPLSHKEVDVGKNVLKYKRQVRDWYNKHVHDEETINEVAKVIQYPKEEECYTQLNTDTVDLTV